MPAGRPLKWTPEALEKAIDEYFASCRDKDTGEYIKPLTITGLALVIGSSRQELIDYEQREEFRDTIKRAKLTVEAFAENMLFSGKNAAGPIFALKNFGWSDKHEVEHTGKDGGAIEVKDTEVARRLAFLLTGGTKEA